jgi:hypothetical protein
MRLDDARLCLDCEEIHDERECPACGSEAFAFLKRWIKSTAEADRPGRAARRIREVAAHTAPPSEQLDAWRQIVADKPAAPRRGRLIARGLLGLAAMGAAGWFWAKGAGDKNNPK